MRVYLFLVFIFGFYMASAQFSFSGKVMAAQEPVIGATINIKSTNRHTVTDLKGEFVFENIGSKTIEVSISSIGFKSRNLKIVLPYAGILEINLETDNFLLNEVVVSGNLKEVSKSESAMAIDVIKPDLFRKNASSGLFEGIQMVSGVRPQVNCSICNTGDIHINGMEGPYTAVLIDGMPIVSALGTVYGLMGIPTGLIERLEVVKGPASTLYGTEAVAGLINIITKKTNKAPAFWSETNLNSWGETSLDLGFTKKQEKYFWLSGLSLFGFNRTVDKNKDGFTDLSLQKRASWFNKFSYGKNLASDLAVRVLIEDRWGGQTHFKNEFKGTDLVYGETIKTRRLEILGKNPISNNFELNYSYIRHYQDSYYGTTPFFAKQNILFGQALYRKNVSNNSFLFGAPIKYTYYDDNTVVTAFENENNPQSIINPSIFGQFERDITSQFKLLAAWRLDYFSSKKWVQSPRLAIKLRSKNQLNVFRINYGNGFRWVNVFSEDHAALTGAREVIISDNLRPEKSNNISFNFEKKIPFKKSFFGIDASVFYSYFSNKIMPDYDSHPEKIFYNNISGYLTSKGINFSMDYQHQNSLRFNMSLSILDIRNYEDNKWERPLLTETYSGTGMASYFLPKLKTTLDYTVNWLSPMRLPLAGSLDPRPKMSPLTHIHNLQFTGKWFQKTEVYFGLKNLFDFLPYKNLPFIISRSNDPFDKQVNFDSSGRPISNSENPYGLTFDPSYVYTSLQGIRLFGGFRVNI